MKESEKNFDDTKPQKYYDYDDTEYKGIRDVKYLFDLSVNEDYYKPIIINSAFNNNFIQYESMGYKDKNLSAKKYHHMIRPYLNDVINDHKTQGERRIHSGNTIIKLKTQGEWKIHLIMEINFISSKKDSDETRTICIKSNNIKIMMGSETDEIAEELFKSLLQRY